MEALRTAGEIAAAFLVVAGLAVTTVAVYGALRLPDLWSRLHAATKSLSAGVLVIVAAGLLLGDGNLAARAFLIGLFLALTGPVSASVIGQGVEAERGGIPAENGDGSAPGAP